MPKGPQGQKRPGDVVGAAIRAAEIATGEMAEEIEPKRESAALNLGARAAKLGSKTHVKAASGNRSKSGKGALAVVGAGNATDSSPCNQSLKHLSVFLDAPRSIMRMIVPIAIVSDPHQGNHGVEMLRQRPDAGRGSQSVAGRFDFQSIRADFAYRCPGTPFVVEYSKCSASPDGAAGGSRAPPAPPPRIPTG